MRKHGLFGASLLTVFLSGCATTEKATATTTLRKTTYDVGVHGFHAGDQISVKQIFGWNIDQAIQWGNFLLIEQNTESAKVPKAALLLKKGKSNTNFRALFLKLSEKQPPAGGYIFDVPPVSPYLTKLQLPPESSGRGAALVVKIDECIVFLKATESKERGTISIAGGNFLFYQVTKEIVFRFGKCPEPEAPGKPPVAPKR